MIRLQELTVDAGLYPSGPDDDVLGRLHTHYSTPSVKIKHCKKLQDDARTPTPAIRYHRCHIENILSHIILRDDIDHAVRGFR